MPDITTSASASAPLRSGDFLYGERDGAAVRKFSFEDVRSSVSGDAALRASLGARPYKWITPGVDVTIPVVPQAGVTIVSQGYEQYKGERCYRVTATGIAATGNVFDVQLPDIAQGVSGTSLHIEIGFDDVTGLSSIYPFLTDQPSQVYSKYITCSFGGTASPAVTLSPLKNGMSHYVFGKTQLTTTSLTTGAVGDYAWRGGRLRITIINGRTVTLWLRSVTVGGAGRGTSRIAIRSDDGYLSFTNFGQRILDEYGLKSSLGIIPERVGGSGFVTSADIDKYVAAGNEGFTHGPNRPGYLNGSVFDAWATNAEIVADIVSVREYIKTRGWYRGNGERGYIWPTGRYLTSLTDDQILYDLNAAGFTTAFGTTENIFQSFRQEFISTGNPFRMAIPCVGHTWSSTDETTNINNVVSRIQAAVDSGLDCHLKLHKVVGINAAASTIEISSNNLRTICAAIRGHIDSGAARNVLLSDFVA